MKKLSLKLDDLSVETFETAAPEVPRGTVKGQQEEYSPGWLCTSPISCDYGCNTRDDGTCPTAYTCRDTCWQTCRTCTEAPCCGGGTEPTYEGTCDITCPPYC